TILRPWPTPSKAPWPAAAIPFPHRSSTTTTTTTDRRGNLPVTEFDTRQLRNTLGSFATGVTVITALDADGTPRAMTANSFSSVSLDPPLVLWSIGKDALAFDAFTQCKHFAIHVLKQDQQALSSRFATREARTFDDLQMEHGVGGVPLFSDYLSRFQCELH